MRVIRHNVRVKCFNGSPGPGEVKLGHKQRNVPRCETSGPRLVISAH